MRGICYISGREKSPVRGIPIYISGSTSILNKLGVLIYLRSTNSYEFKQAKSGGKNRISSWWVPEIKLYWYRNKLEVELKSWNVSKNTWWKFILSIYLTESILYPVKMNKNPIYWIIRPQKEGVWKMISSFSSNNIIVY